MTATTKFNLAKKLIKAASPKNSWDEEVLNMAAEDCATGGKAHEFDGRPTDSQEFAAFQKAWNKAQA